MSIHTKSLNQLANELEGRAAQRKEPQAKAVAKSDDQQAIQTLIDAINNFTQKIAAISASAPTNAPLEAEMPTHAEKFEAPQARPFFMDSTLGVRTRPSQREQVRKSEQEIRLYSGFISRGQITGEY